MLSRWCYCFGCVSLESTAFKMKIGFIVWKLISSSLLLLVVWKVYHQMFMFNYKCRRLFQFTLDSMIWSRRRIQWKVLCVRKKSCSKFSCCKLCIYLFQFDPLSNLWEYDLNKFNCCFSEITLKDLDCNMNSIFKLCKIMEISDGYIMVAMPPHRK